MNDIFEANERLKEKMVSEFFASKAKTILHQNGTYYLSDPFLETEILWDSLESFKNLSTEKTKEMVKDLKQLQEQIVKLGGQMTPPMFEAFEGKSPMLVWAQFFTDGSEKNL